MESTFGLVSLSLKRKVLQAIKDSNSQLLITFDKQLELTKEQALEILKKDIKELKIPVYAFILEGTNAIKEWLNIIDHLNAAISTSKNFIIFGQSNPKENQRNIIWLKSLVERRPSSIPTSKIKATANRTTTTMSSEVTPNKKKVTASPSTRAQINTDKKGNTTTQKKATDQRTNRVRKVAVKKEEASDISREATTANKKVVRQRKQLAVTVVKKEKTLSVIEAKGTVITGKGKTNNKPQQPGTKITNNKDKPKETEELNIQAQSNSSKSEQKVSATGGSLTKEGKDDEEKTIIDMTENTKASPSQELIEEEDHNEKTTDIDPVPLVSHPSTCSSATTDEHDAEVARLTSSKKYSIDSSSTHSGYSPLPTTIASRPETPEVNFLRSKFEQLSSGNKEDEHHQQQRKKSADASRNIKEWKPRGPVGSKVRSMVDMFMDENFNRWEF